MPEQPEDEREQPQGERELEEAGIDLEVNPDVRSVELEGDDGEPIVIAQQNVGPGARLGQGEFPDPETPPKSASTAQAEQDALQRDAPI